MIHPRETAPATAEEIAAYHATHSLTPEHMAQVDRALAVERENSNGWCRLHVEKFTDQNAKGWPFWVAAGIVDIGTGDRPCWISRSSGFDFWVSGDDAGECAETLEGAIELMLQHFKAPMAKAA